MHKLMKSFVAGILVAVLVACGGGGGSAGKTTGSSASGTTSSTTTVSTVYPTMVAVLQDATSNPSSGIAATGYSTLKVTLKDPSGAGIANQPINVAADPKLVFPDGNTALTDASGVANFKVGRSTLTVTGAGALAISYSYDVGSIATYSDGSTPPATAKVVTAFAGYQLTTTNVVLSLPSVGATTLAAYGTRQVSVTATVNGVVTPGVVINLSATCGQVTPSSATTNVSGVAVVTYVAVDAVGVTPSTLGCGGQSVDITASTVSATAVKNTLNITATAATNMGFVSASPSRIYLSGSGGATTSALIFELKNAQGALLPAQNIVLTLKNQGAGSVKASFDTVGNTTAVTKTTDSLGRVTVSVFSGTVPTSVVVNAALASNPLVQTDSAILVIASGRPTQARATLSVSAFAIEGFNVAGITTGITMSLADRQGNPVPDGTVVNFVTEGGTMVPPTCVTGVTPGDSRCSVTIRSGNPVPTNGRVSVLAYSPGEEDFVDNDFSNDFSSGDTFTDMGNAYRDDDENGVYNSSLDGFTVPRTGSVACAGGENGRANSCDGIWGAIDVRKQAVIVFSTSGANINSPVWTQAADAAYGGTVVTTALALTIQDNNVISVNSMPTGSAIAVVAVDKSVSLPTTGGLVPVGISCTLVSQSHTAVPNTTGALNLLVNLKDCVRGDQVQVTVTGPNLGQSLATLVTFTIP